MTIVDLIKDLIDTSKERLKTPISGAFIWSFLIYNWRPIAVLFFSNAPLEDRIVVINDVYCGYLAIIMPIVIAFIYTVGVPMLMVQIDKLLIKTKKTRVDNIYESKEHTIDKKITLAKKEFELKNAESGNKQIDELQERINTLEETNSQITQANKNTVEQLNIKLKEVNESLSNVLNPKMYEVLEDSNLDEYKKIIDERVKRAKDLYPKEFGSLILETLDNFSIEDAKMFGTLKVENGVLKLNTRNRIPNIFIKELINTGFIRQVNSGTNINYYLTDFGKIMYEIFQFNKEV